MAPVNAPVPGPSSTTVTGRSVGMPATIASASARELAETAPTVRGIPQEAADHQHVFAQSGAACDQPCRGSFTAVRPGVVGQRFEQAFRQPAACRAPS